MKIFYKFKILKLQSNYYVKDNEYQFRVGDIVREKEFITLMLISGQIKLLNKISKSLNLPHSVFSMKIKDKYFD